MKRAVKARIDAITAKAVNKAVWSDAPTSWLPIKMPTATWNGIVKRHAIISMAENRSHPIRKKAAMVMAGVREPGMNLARIST